ncbi:hypothetical protein [Corynebacterium nasicanis]|uniref:Uncharacterized protein n=1 Tax=Corynebacterium nasicanis TaxID=1448267 RepID=A0ABW1QAI2_9CORY
MSAPLPRPRPTLASKGWIWALAVLLFAAICLGAMVAWAQHREGRIVAAATEACQESITEYAKYPGGVSFPHDMEFTPGKTDREILTSEGTVDFPNGWGTPVRHDYTCLAIVKGPDDVIPLAVVEARDRD